MAVTQDKAAPYAPASAILEIIQTHRRKGLPSPITAEVLQRVGVSDSLIPRTFLAMQALDLIDEQGKVTRALEGLRLAPEGEFKDRLSEWLKLAYADVLTYVDPATDDETRVRDAFRTYNPVGQQPRMVSLFMGLAAAAGMVGENPVVPTPIRTVRLHSPKITARKPPRAPESPSSTAHKSPAKFWGGGDLPLPLTGLLSSLPRDGEAWTKARRDKFVETFEAVIDFCYRVEEETSSSVANQVHTKEEEGHK